MAALSKSEYLKRYLSKNDLPAEDRKKKKKHKTNPKSSNMRIIDDDIDVRSMGSKKNPLLNTFDEEEEQPLVVEIIDERPQHVRELEVFQDRSQWKSFGASDSDDGIIIPGSSYDQEKTRHAKSNKDVRKIIASRKRHDSDSDRSPPTYSRRPRHDSDSDASPSQCTLQRHDSDTDPSPPRKGQVGSKTDVSSCGNTGAAGIVQKQRKMRHDSESDQSPPRNNFAASYSDQSPSRRKTTGSDSDHSPPRRKRAGPDSDQSPPRRKRAGPDSDQSPPRRKRAGPDSDQSPPRRKRTGSDSDQSPPRRNRAGPDSDQSPPRRKRTGSDSDQSPPRRKRAGPDSDQSPSRRKSFKSNSLHSAIGKRKSRFASPDSRNSRQPSKQRPGHSPPRKRRHDSDSDSSPPRGKGGHSNAHASSSSSKPKKTLAGAKAGLSSAAEMRKEVKELRDIEDSSFNKIDDETLGKNAQTVMRDKATGRRRNMEAEKELTEEEARKKEEQMKRFQQWGKGMRQQEERDKRLTDHVHEASKPMARYQDDEDLDQMMRGEERSEDPMLAFIRNKKKKQEEKSGKVKKKEFPRYSGQTPPPPNRFNIWPGCRWDGVDRSNGFEGKLFASIANKKAVAEIAYKWSTEDM